MEQLPNRIRELRTARGFYLEHLANRIGCGTTYLSDIERGVRELSYPWMKRIAKVLKVQVADLLSESDNSRSLSAAEQELIALYDSADEAQRAQLLQMARIVVGGAAPAKGKRAA